MRILARVICFFRSPDSQDDEAVAHVTLRESATRRATIQQTFADRIADELFDSIAHGPRTELRMKSFPHEERQRGLVQLLRWTPKTGPQVKMDFCRSAGEEKADYESKTETA